MMSKIKPGMYRCIQSSGNLVEGKEYYLRNSGLNTWEDKFEFSVYSSKKSTNLIGWLNVEDLNKYFEPLHEKFNKKLEDLLK